MANVLDRLPKREQTEAKRRLWEVVYAESRAGAEKARDAFADRYADTYPKAVEILAGDWGRMTAFFDFPAGHWRHLRTTNVVESPFAAVRLRTSVAKRFRKVDGATALIWKLLMVAEKRFRKLNSPHLLPGVLAGKRYADGKPVPRRNGARPDDRLRTPVRPARAAEGRGAPAPPGGPPRQGSGLPTSPDPQRMARFPANPAPRAPRIRPRGRPHAFGLPLPLGKSGLLHPSHARCN